MKTMEEARKLAKKVSEFIIYNKIDTSKISMDKIVEEYFKCQMLTINKIESELLNN